MRKIKIICIGIVLYALTGCDLSETPTSFVDTDNYFLNEAQIKTGLNSVYIPLKSIFKFNYLLVTEGAADLLWVASGTLDAQLDISPSNPRFGTTMWQQGYKGVMYCNSIIAAIDRAELKDDNVKRRLKAEAMVMRAYYYWFLTSTFGDVPFYTQDVSDVDVLNEVSQMGRVPATFARDSLIKELSEYVPYLPQIRTYEDPESRAGAAMGWLLIGKLAQWNKEWDVAREAIGHVEEIYGDLGQYPLDDIAFKNSNTPEDIFEVQFTYSRTGLKVTSNVASLLMPHRDSGDIYDGVQIPELGDQATTYTALRPNTYFYQNLQPKQVHDLRTELNMAWEYNGIPFKSAGTRPWLGPKFWSYDMINSEDGNNIPLFRYADAILMQAENYLELRDENKAIEYLNMVRRRAELPDYSFRNWDLLREEIYAERGRELLGEFQRKYDLVRWGIWFQQTYDFTDYSSLKNNMRPCHRYYPIPDVEVNKSKGNLDNKEYEANGLN